ncbi:rab-GTPase-TBC domain-containing protein [Ochromonadaceae sp. CCMP2298]|nr:rab-GTPase-TBC domain-containing protein [Ochromonadaceae sp. CCMP2298]
MSKISSWISNKDGSVVEGDVKFYPFEDGTYEVEAMKESAGFVLGLDKVTSMQRFKGLICTGDVLVAVNDRLIIDESFEEVVMILTTLVQGAFSRRLKFLHTAKCPLELYLQRLQTADSVQTDLLGFSCSFEYRAFERASHAAHEVQNSLRDVEWVGYLKAIGGPENLKPAGVFKPSADLKAIVRRGVPVAYRALVWPKISLSSLLRREYPDDYYESLLARAGGQGRAQGQRQGPVESGQGGGSGTDSEGTKREGLKGAGGEGSGELKEEKEGKEGTSEGLKEGLTQGKEGTKEGTEGRGGTKGAEGAEADVGTPTLAEGLSRRVKDEIEKDLDRTFPDHAYFDAKGGGEQGLRRVLQAFAVHNPAVGYCQSLNFLAGMMLIFMEEIDAFWLLVSVVERLLPFDYYTASMVGTYADQFVLGHIVKKCLPRVHGAFETHNVQLPLITVQWFMCIFVNTLRPEVALRIWDMFLNEGSKVLFRIGAALFQLEEGKLLLAKDAADLFTQLKGMGRDLTDADALIALAYPSFTPAGTTPPHSPGRSRAKGGSGVGLGPGSGLGLGLGVGSGSGSGSGAGSGSGLGVAGIATATGTGAGAGGVIRQLSGLGMGGIWWV